MSFYKNTKSWISGAQETGVISASIKSLTDAWSGKNNNVLNFVPKPSEFQSALKRLDDRQPK